MTHDMSAARNKSPNPHKRDWHGRPERAAAASTDTGTCTPVRSNTNVDLLPCRKTKGWPMGWQINCNSEVIERETARFLCYAADEWRNLEAARRLVTQTNK